MRVQSSALNSPCLGEGFLFGHSLPFSSRGHRPVNLQVLSLRLPQLTSSHPLRALQQCSGASLPPDAQIQDPL